MIPTKIVLIGAGSANFGLNTLGALMRSKILQGSQIALVDRDPHALEIVKILAERLNGEWRARMKITTHLSHKDALLDADFVVSAIEVPPREKLWRMDFEIPLKHGLRQPYSENGGPGGFAHAARNIGPVLEIAHDMEDACPQAWLINFTNPMMRVCDAVARHSRIKVVGLCHQVKYGYYLVGLILGKDLGLNNPDANQTMQKVDIKAAGLNHFTWIVDLRDRTTGADLYPLLRQRFFELDPGFEPLSRRIFNAFGLFPVPGDTHMSEYLPWLSDPQTHPWEKLNIHLFDWDAAEIRRDEGRARMQRLGRGEEDLAPLLNVESEGALEVIEAIAAAGNCYHLAVNLPNEGYVTNLPQGAMIEVPGLVSGLGVRGVGVGPLPVGVAELCRREITVTQLTVDSVVQGDRRLALQALLFSPGISDIDVAQEILDDYLVAYREHLPTFWK